MKRPILTSILGIMGLLLVSNAYASQSTVTEAEGYSCMGEDKSRKQTEQTALTEAKKKAVETVKSYVKSETKVKNFEFEKDVVEAYTNATIKVIQEIEKKWFKDSAMGDCYKMMIKAEVIPDEKAMVALANSESGAEDPTAPLRVKVWSDKKEYRQGEKVKIYLKGNKPFFARVVYTDAGGNMVQLLPNPYRSDNYFNGGVVYEVPSGSDQFDLEVNPPYGEENVSVYASTGEVGDINIEKEGGLYLVTSKAGEIGTLTRGIKIKDKSGSQAGIHEFSEENVTVKTGK